MRCGAAKNRDIKLSIELRGVSGSYGDARFQLCKIQKASTVQREIVDLSPADYTLNRIRFEIDGCGFSLNVDNLFCRSHLHCNIEGSRSAGLYHDGSSAGSKPGGLYFNLVGTGRK